MEIIKIENNKEYGLVVSSRLIANQFKKRHCDVLEAIDKLLIDNSNFFKNQSTEISVDLKKIIISSQYRDSRNRNYREYLLTKDGLTLYMFNILGYNDLKMAYINKFNEMEKELQEQKQLNNAKQLMLCEPSDELIDNIKACKHILSLILDGDSNKTIKSWRKSLSTIEKFLIDLRELVVN